LLKLLLQFDALVTTQPLSDGGEEAQLKRIVELQVWSQLIDRAQIQDSKQFLYELILMVVLFTFFTLKFKILLNYSE
jgi:hypothetical protein